MSKIHPLEVNGKRIGYTEFEYADPPMGVIYGKIIFDGVEFPYKFFKDHCVMHGVQISYDDPGVHLIGTAIIPQLHVYLPNGEELQGWGAAISGIDQNDYEIQFEGISSELMKTEFEHHYIAYWGVE